MTDIPPPDTPPVLDTEILHRREGWDGVERRNTDPLKLAIESAVTRVQGVQTSPDISATQHLILQLIALALVVIGVIGIWVVSRKLDKMEDNSQRFRDSITCYVIGTHTGPAGAPDPNILTRCRFVGISGG